MALYRRLFIKSGNENEAKILQQKKRNLYSVSLSVKFF